MRRGLRAILEGLLWLGVVEILYHAGPTYAVVLGDELVIDGELVIGIAAFVLGGTLIVAGIVEEVLGSGA